MEINQDVVDILKEFKIDKSEGLLCLLGYYYNLDVEKVCSEESIKAIALTHIVDKDYNNNTLTWNIPLFAGQETEFGWVKDWAKAFTNINPERVSSTKDVTSRMKEFFKRHPAYRKDDVYKARDMYLSTVKDSKYLKSAHKFIVEGMGATKVSMLLSFCERLETASKENFQKGRVVT